MEEVQELKKDEINLIVFGLLETICKELAIKINLLNDIVTKDPYFS